MTQHDLEATDHHYRKCADCRIAVGEHITIYRRGSRGTWTADFHYIDQNGRRRHSRKSLHTRNQRAAESAARKLDVDLARSLDMPTAGGTTVLAPSSIVGIDDAIKLFVDAKKTDGCARKTTVKYEGELKNFAKYLRESHGVVAIHALSILLVDQYKAHRRNIDQLNSYTLHAHLMIIKGWLRWCKTRGLITGNPLAELEVAQPRRRRHPAATIEQVNGILAVANGWLFAVVATLAFTGLRLGEVVALRPADVDLANGVIHVRRREGWGPKTENSERTVPIHRRLLAILRAVKKPKGTSFLNAPPSRDFPVGDHAVNPREVNARFQALARQCGHAVGREQQGLTAHGLRRMFKTFCLDSGVPKPMVDAWMGHRNQKEMDFFYYDPRKSNEWMERVPFGEPDGQDLQHLKGVSDERQE
jgi:integrase